MTEVKFCGMTREDDLRHAAQLGAAYVGAIMTESPRRVEPARAAELFSSIADTTVRSVAVFGDEPIAEIIRMTRLAGPDVIQLHGQATAPDSIRRLHEELGVEVWRVIRVGQDGLTTEQKAAFREAEGVLLDTLAPGALGGTGTPFNWDAVAADVRGRRAGQRRRLIVAGGLRPGNVRLAIDRLAPDVVDVSSGVESAPGVKDHCQMSAFIAAVREDSATPTQ